MTVGTPQQTNFQVDSGTVYKTGIDNNFKIMLAREAQFAPHEQTSPVMTVRVEAGTISAYDGTNTTYAAQSTGTITAPVSNSRIDVVVLNPSSGALTVITGTPGASPAVPAISNDRIPLCQILLTSLSTAITNLMITDMRPTCGFFNNLRIPGTLNVQGAVTFASTLGVSGAVTCNTSLAVTTTSTLTGKVGINQAVGTEYLEVTGAIRAAGASANFNTGSEGIIMDFTGTVARIGHVNGASGSARDVQFMISGGTVATLKSGGGLNVGAPSGTPSAGDVNISGAFKINGTSIALAATFASSAQIWAVNTVYSVAHSLGYTPTHVWMNLNFTANDSTYLSGDTIQNIGIMGPINGANNFGISVWADGTNVNYHTASAGLAVQSKTAGGGVVTPTVANSKILIFAGKSF